MSYNITTTLVNLTATGATTITDTATVTLAASTGYALPMTITVANADYSYDYVTGVISLSNPTADVTITATGLTQQERFNAVANGLVDTINDKAGTSGTKTLDEALQAAKTIVPLSSVPQKEAATYTPTTTDQTIASGQYLAGAQTIEGVVCENLLPENIKKDVVVKIGTATDDDSVTTVTGSYEGGGVELNIAYGANAPADTSKLWVKGNTPTNTTITPNMVGNESVQAAIATLPEAARGMATAAIGTNVYMFGGADASFSSYYTTIKKLDTLTNTVTTLTPVTIRGTGRAIATVGNKIYLFGGLRGSSVESAIQVFDTSSETISTLSVTWGYWGSAAAAMGTKIYLFGGKSSSYLQNSIRIFDTETNTITTLGETLPIYMVDMRVSTVGTKVYLFGGRGGSTWTADSELSSIIEFDVLTNSSRTLTETVPLYAPSASVAFGTKIYLFGSRSSSSTSIYLFDTITETKTLSSTLLPTATSDFSAAIVGTKIYLCGGGYSAAINDFIISTSLDNDDVIIQTDIIDNQFNIINTPNNTITTGVKAVYRGNSSNVAELEDAYLYQNGSWIQISERPSA